MNSRLVSAMVSSLSVARGWRGARRGACCSRLHAREIARHDLEFLVGVTLGLLVHDRRRPLTGLDLLQRLQQGAPVTPGKARRDIPHAAAFRAVAGETGRNQAT